MSKYGTVNTTINNADDLMAGLRAMGFKDDQIENCVGKPKSLYGYQGDERKEKADIIIRREHIGMASNDIGFVRNNDGTFSSVVSEYDSRKYGSEWQKRLAFQCGDARIKRVAASKGLRSVGAPTLVNGKYRYEYVKA